MAAGEWFLHRDNAPVQTARLTLDFLETRNIKTLLHAPYSPDLAPTDFWLLPTVKAVISGVHIKDDSARTEWERVCRTLPTSAFTAAFQKWEERHRKCIRIEGDYVEKCTSYFFALKYTIKKS